MCALRKKGQIYVSRQPTSRNFSLIFITHVQALLANMAAMYAVYHGPAGLKAIGERVHGLASTFASGLKKLGTVTVQELPFFDTVKIKCADAHAIAEAAYKHEINLRVVDSETVCDTGKYSQ